MQRPSLGGHYVSSFKQVLYRHGVTMGCIALLGLSLVSQFRSDYGSDFFSRPAIYVITGGIILAFFIIFLRFRKWELNEGQFFWILYLLCISIVEEIAFRLTIPAVLLGTLGSVLSIFISNLLFAAIHYVTLRWKLIPCISAFIGGVGLSHLLENTENIALLILVHWFVTFLNTPRPPKNIVG